jgi:hypothetical protein
MAHFAAFLKRMKKSNLSFFARVADLLSAATGVFLPTSMHVVFVYARPYRQAVSYFPILR